MKNMTIRNIFKATLYAVGISVLLIVLWGLSVLFLSKYKYTYRVEKVYLEEFELEDSLLSDYRLYFLSFDLSPVRYKYGGLVHGTPYEGGCADRIIGLSFETASHAKLNKHIGLLHSKDSIEVIRLYSAQEMNVPRDIDFYYSLEYFQEIIQKGYEQRHSMRRGRVGLPDLYIIAIDKNNPPPQYVTIKFDDRVIRGIVNNTNPKKFEVCGTTYKDSIGEFHFLHGLEAKNYLRSFCMSHYINNKSHHTP